MPLTPAGVSERTERPLTFGVWVAGIIRRWPLVFKVMGLVLIAASIGAVLIPPAYRAHASFVANTSSASKMAGGLAGTAGLAGLANQFGLGSRADPSESPNFYAKLIQSDELRRRLVHSYFPNPRTANSRDSATLIQILKIKNKNALRREEIAIKMVSKSVMVDFDGSTNLVTLTVNSRWPELAAAIANRTISLVDGFNREQRVSRARSKRTFVEDRLTTAKAELHAAEDRQKQFYEQNRLWRSSPHLVFEEGRIQRNTDVAEDLFLTLQRQFEAARLEEFSDAALITIVDPGVPPQKAQWPRYWLLLASALAIGGILGLLAAGSATVLADWTNRNPATASELSDSLAAIPRVRRRGADGARIVH